MRLVMLIVGSWLIVIAVGTVIGAALGIIAANTVVMLGW